MATSLHQLATQAEAFRNQEWEAAFLKTLPESLLTVEAPVAKAGPDGWPYLFVRTSETGTEPFLRMADWLCEQGIGLAINAHKDVPDFTLNYGMIWNFRERGEFITKAKVSSKENVEFRPGQKIWTLEPDLNVLPIYVRRVLIEFLADQGVTEPRVNMISTTGETYDLCFSLESLGNPPKEEHEGIAEALSWFLPLHYSLILITERMIPNFKALRATDA